MGGKKINVNQILLSKLWYRGQIYTIPKYINKETEKRIYSFLCDSKKYDFPGNQLKSRGGIYILDLDTQLNCIILNGLLLNPANVLWKDLMVYLLKLIMNSDHT